MGAVVDVDTVTVGPDNVRLDVPRAALGVVDVTLDVVTVVLGPVDVTLVVTPALLPLLMGLFHLLPVLGAVGVTALPGAVTPEGVVVTVAFVVGVPLLEVDAVAVALLDVPPGVNTVLLLLLVPVGDVAVALLVAPAPVEFTNDVERLELLLIPAVLVPGALTPRVLTLGTFRPVPETLIPGGTWAVEGGATETTTPPTIPIHREHLVKFNMANNLFLVAISIFQVVVPKKITLGFLFNFFGFSIFGNH